MIDLWMENLTGFTAATLTTIAFIPQAFRVWRTGSTSAISLWMYIIFASGVAFWLAYGIMLDKQPMVIANAITLTLALGILYRKWRNVRSGNERP